MNPFSRGAKNAWRSPLQTGVIIVILALAIGLALAMLVARQAVEQKVADTTKQMNDLSANVGTSLTITPAGQGGGAGGIYGGMRGGDAGQSADNSGSSLTLTSADLTSVEKVANITSASAVLNERSSSSDTNLTAAPITVPAGARMQIRDSSGNQTGGNGGQSFTPPVAFDGVSDLSAAANALGGSITFTSGSASDFDATSSANIAIVGDQIAKQNKLSVGSTFTAYGQTVKVVGIISSGSASTTSSDTPARIGRSMGLGSAVVMPLATLQNISGNSGSIDQIVATVNSAKNVSSATTAVEKIFGTDSNGNNLANVQNEQQQASFAKTSAENTISNLQSIESVSTMGVVASASAAAIIIFIAMVMIVRERRNEIGVLKAIGAKTSRISLQFVAESLTMTVIASVIGLGIGVAMAGPLTSTLVSNQENSSNSATSGQQGFGGFAKNTSRTIGAVTANVDWKIVAEAFGAAVMIAAIGAAGASVLVARVRPSEAIRQE